jgi:hypothetical protein
MINPFQMFATVKFYEKAAAACAGQYSGTRRFRNFYEQPLPASSRASAVLIG